MKTSATVLLASALIGWLPLNVLADGGPDCVLDEGTGLYVPADGSGACFGDFGFALFVIDLPNGGLLFAGNPPDDNQWFRNNPNGRGRFHAAGDVQFLLYCAPETVFADACFPGSDEAFLGQGEAVLNTDQQALAFTCPLTARVKGTAGDAYGNVVDVTAAFTRVPDPEAGCRVTLRSVAATPVIEE